MRKVINRIMLGITVVGLLAGCANVQEEFESAVHRDNLGEAEKWLARGATVNPKRKNRWEWSLLDEVTYWGDHEEMVYWLLKHGATAGNGAVPWQAMAMLGNPELLRFRLEKGANVNEKDDKDRLRVETFWACDRWGGTEKCFIKAIEYLHKYGVKIHDFNYEMTPLQYAVSKGWLEAVKYLLKQGADVKDRNCRGDSAIHFANNPQIVKFLLDHGADINSKNNEGITPIHYAVDRYTETAMDILKLLLKHGADINSKDRKGNTPLHYVCSQFRLDYQLPDNPAVHEPFYRGCFCKKCQLERLKYLIARGANVNAQNEMGQTVLHLAVLEHAGDDVIEYLTKHGADLNLRDRNGMTVLDLVQKNHNERLESIRKAYGSTSDKSMNDRGKQ